VKRSRPAIAPSVVRKLREISEQITDAFWNNVHSEYIHLAEWTLQYFHTEFDIARTPHQLQPKTHAMLLNLEVLCSLMIHQSTPAFRRVEALRQGVADTRLNIPAQKVVLKYDSSSRLMFSGTMVIGRAMVVTPFVTAPWDEEFYYYLGKVGAYLVKKQAVPKRTRHRFNDAIQTTVSPKQPVTVLMMPFETM